jgi:hypothetical protein
VSNRIEIFIEDLRESGVRGQESGDRRQETGEIIAKGKILLRISNYSFS